MKIIDQAEADVYFEQLVQHLIEHGTEERTRAQAEAVERSNLGYFAGYFDSETRERVERLFKCSHPVFGSIPAKGAPAAKEAFDAGVKLGKKSKEVK